MQLKSMLAASVAALGLSLSGAAANAASLPSAALGIEHRATAQETGSATLVHWRGGHFHGGFGFGGPFFWGGPAIVGGPYCYWGDPYCYGGGPYWYGGRGWYWRHHHHGFYRHHY